jgi:predicted NBD/HSP70 family sugar kinase
MGSGGLPESPVRQESLRAHNLSLVFRQLLDAHGRPLSRTELVEATGLTKPTISRIIDDLIRGELIIETGATNDGRTGRPRIALTLSDRGPAGLGLDIRDDRLAACVVDLTGNVRRLEFLPCPTLGSRPDDLLGHLADLARAVIESVRESGLSVVQATLAAPGPIQDEQVIRSAPGLGWTDVDAGPRLKAALEPINLPIAIGNEAHLAALAELHAGQDNQASFAYVSGGLAIGAGLVLHGRLIQGVRGWSGELGHLTIAARGRKCRCGARGCLQTYAGLAEIRGRGTDTGVTTVSEINLLADAGAVTTLRALDTAAHALGIALADLVNLLDLDTIVLGGGYAVLASWLMPGIQSELRERVLTKSWAPITVRPGFLGPDAAVIGAALTALDRVRRNPTEWLASRNQATA